jgi:hypothetical protein
VRFAFSAGSVAVMRAEASLSPRSVERRVAAMPTNQKLSKPMVWTLAGVLGAAACFIALSAVTSNKLFFFAGCALSTTTLRIPRLAGSPQANHRGSGSRPPTVLCQHKAGGWAGRAVLYVSAGFAGLRFKIAL